MQIECGTNITYSSAWRKPGGGRGGHVGRDRQQSTDFYREDGQYNLFGEDDHENTCTWRIDNKDTTFPYYNSYDRSYNPLDIGNDWFVHRENSETLSIPEFNCGVEYN